MTHSTLAVLLAAWLLLPVHGGDCPEGRDCGRRGLDRLLTRRRQAGHDATSSEPPVPSLPRLNAPVRARRARRTEQIPLSSASSDTLASSALDSSVALRRAQRRPRPNGQDSESSETRKLLATVDIEFDYFDAEVPEEDEITDPWLDRNTEIEEIDRYSPLVDPAAWQTVPDGVVAPETANFEWSSNAEEPTYPTRIGDPRSVTTAPMTDSTKRLHFVNNATNDVVEPSINMSTSPPIHPSRSHLIVSAGPVFHATTAPTIPGSSGPTPKPSTTTTSFESSTTSSDAWTDDTSSSSTYTSSTVSTTEETFSSSENETSTRPPRKKGTFSLSYDFFLPSSADDEPYIDDRFDLASNAVTSDTSVDAHDTRPITSFALMRPPPLLALYDLSTKPPFDFSSSTSSSEAWIVSASSSSSSSAFSSSMSSTSDEFANIASSSTTVTPAAQYYGSSSTSTFSTTDSGSAEDGQYEDALEYYYDSSSSSSSSSSTTSSSLAPTETPFIESSTSQDGWPDNSSSSSSSSVSPSTTSSSGSLLWSSTSSSAQDEFWTSTSSSSSSFGFTIPYDDSTTFSSSSSTFCFDCSSTSSAWTSSASSSSYATTDFFSSTSTLDDFSSSSTMSVEISSTSTPSMTDSSSTSLELMFSESSTSTSADLATSSSTSLTDMFVSSTPESTTDLAWTSSSLPAAVDWTSEITTTDQPDSSSSSVGMTDDAVSSGPPLDFIPFKSMTHLTPLEALVEEPDLSLLGGAIKANEKYPVLKKVGMTIFAPVDKAFAALPIDMGALQNPSGLVRKTVGADANLELGAAQRVMRQLPKSSVHRRQLAAASRWGFPRPALAEDPCDPYEGRGCGVGAYSAMQGISDLIPPAYGQAHADRKLRAAKNVMDDFERLIMFHVVKRIVPPGMIEAKKTLLLRTEMKGYNLDVQLVPALSEGGERELIIGNQARVVEIVACRNGFIYKIDGPLFPAWNQGAPNLLEAIRSNPNFSRLRYLMEESKMFDSWALAGPVTILLIPDNAWRIDGLQVPPCFFKALVRPENAETLSKLLRWTTIPGLWTRQDIEAVDWLPNGAAPSLAVTTIDMAVWEQSQTQREEAYDSRHNLFSPDVKWGVDIKDARQPPEDPDAEPTMVISEEPPPPIPETRVTLIEGKEVTQWDLQFYNGLGHTVAELPLRPDLDMRGMLWDCMDMFCHECPIVTKFLLKYLDGGGLLPDVTNAKAYIVPPGVRPEWMCHGAKNWFPAGWDPNEWYRYIEMAKTGNGRVAHQLALAGWRSAAGRNAQLEDKLLEAEVHLRQIWRHYADPGDWMLGVKEDPNLLIGWLRNRRSLEYKPRICDPKAPRRPGVLIDTEDPWEGGEQWGSSMVSPSRESFYSAMNRDRQRRFGMEDLRYVTQWI